MDKKTPPYIPLTKPPGNASRIIFVGASTGGTEAVKRFLLGFPADCPPILVVQHMPETFTGSFAARLDSLCRPHIIEAKGGEILHDGMVLMEGTPADIVASPDVRRVYLGERFSL